MGDCSILSGSYEYPGKAGAAAVCTVEKFKGFSDRYSLPFPTRGEQKPGTKAPSGGWRLVEAATNLEIQNDACRAVILRGPISYFLSYLLAGDQRESLLARLEREGARYEVYEEGLLPDDFRIDVWETLRLDLDPTLPGAALDWGPDFLTYRFRFRAAGFGAGLARNFLTLTLRKLDDGALLYHLVHEEKPGGVSHEIECRLPAAGGGGE